MFHSQSKPSLHTTFSVSKIFFAGACMRLKNNTHLSIHVNDCPHEALTSRKFLWGWGLYRWSYWQWCYHYRWLHWRGRHRTRAGGSGTSCPGSKMSTLWWRYSRDTPVWTHTASQFRYLHKKTKEAGQVSQKTGLLREAYCTSYLFQKVVTELVETIFIFNNHYRVYHDQLQHFWKSVLFLVT